MKYLVEVPVGTSAAPASQSAVVEVEREDDGVIEVSRPGQVAARAARSLGEMLAGIRPVAESFVNGLSGMATVPEEIGLEFGLSLSGNANLVVASTAAHANFKVTLTWRPAPVEAPEARSENDGQRS